MKNIPLTNGRMSYLTKFNTILQAHNFAKKQGYKKTDYKIVQFKITKPTSFFGFLWNEKPKTAYTYVLYKK